MSRIGDYRLHAYNLLFKYPICNYADTQSNGRKIENILILGSGYISNELFKASFWAGQFVNTDLHITIASEKAEEYKKVLFNSDNFPALQSFVNKKYATLNFVIVEHWDDFCNKNNLNDYNYIVIANDMGISNDLVDVQECDIMNYCTATTVLNFLGQSAQNKFLGIFNKNKDSISESDKQCLIQNALEKKVEACFFGETFDSNLERIAENINFSYDMTYNHQIGINESITSFTESKEKEFSEEPSYCASGGIEKAALNFLGFGYKADSSFASAVHIPYKLSACRMLSKSKKASDFDALDMMCNSIKNQDRTYGILVSLEHRRWNAYMVMRGCRAPSDEETKKYLYKIIDGKYNNHQCKDKRLHICMCDYKECYKPDQPSAFYTTDKSSLSELDKVSLLAHKLACNNCPKMSDYEKIVSPIKDCNETEFVNYRAAIKKLLNDDYNSYLLYEKTYKDLREKSSSLNSEIAEIDKKLQVAVDRNKRTDFIAFDKELIEKIPFALWYREKYTTLIVISQKCALNDIIIPTMFCALKTVFIVEKGIDNGDYCEIIKNYFAGRGNTTSVSFEEASFNKANSITEKIKEICQSEKNVLLCCPENLDSVYTAAVSVLAKELNVPVTFAKKGKVYGITDYENIAIGLSNKLMVDEVISLIGGEVYHPLEKVVSYDDYLKIEKLFVENNIYYLSKKNKKCSLWTVMSEFFKKGTNDEKPDCCKNLFNNFGVYDLKKYDTSVKTNDFVFSKKVYDDCKLANWLNNLNDKYIIKCDTKVFSMVTIDSEPCIKMEISYCEKEIFDIINQFTFDKKSDDERENQRFLVPSFTFNDGIKLGSLIVKDQTLFNDNMPQFIQDKCRNFLKSMEKCGFIHDLYFDGNDKVSFIYKNSDIRRLFKTQGSTYEIYNYWKLLLNYKFDDIKTGVSFSWNKDAKSIMRVQTKELENLVSQSDFQGKCGYYLLKIANKRTFKNIYGNVEINGTKNEIDVIATIGMLPIFVSCKTNKDNENGWIYEIYSVSDNFKAIPVMSVSKDFEDKGLLSSEFTSRAMQMKVSLLGTEILYDNDKTRNAFENIVNGEVINVQNNCNKGE